MHYSRVTSINKVIKIYLLAYLINTTIKTTRVLVTEVGALSAAGWAWSGRGRHTLRCQVGVAGWAWSLHGKQT